MYRTVVDTNAIVATEISSRPNTATKAILEKWREGVIDLLVTDDILMEYAEIMLRLGFPGSDR